MNSTQAVKRRVVRVAGRRTHPRRRIHRDDLDVRQLVLVPHVAGEGGVHRLEADTHRPVTVVVEVAHRLDGDVVYVAPVRRGYVDNAVTEHDLSHLAVSTGRDII